LHIGGSLLVHGSRIPANRTRPVRIGLAIIAPSKNVFRLPRMTLFHASPISNLPIALKRIISNHIVLPVFTSVCFFWNSGDFPLVGTCLAGGHNVLARSRPVVPPSTNSPHWRKPAKQNSTPGQPGHQAPPTQRGRRPPTPLPPGEG